MDIKSRVFEIQRLISVNKFSEAIFDCEKLIKKFPENSYFTIYVVLLCKEVTK